MGGFGSGKGSRRRAWRSKKLKTESLPGLIIPELMKMHKENPNSTFTFNNVSLTVIDAVIALKMIDGEELQTPSIKIATFPCNYGGFRYFGYCPVCQKRVRTLYLHKTLFACRHCFKMGYWSQNYTLSYRLLIKRRKVGAKINNDEWTKPEGMRKKTFKRLRRQYRDLDEMTEIADMFSCKNKHDVRKILDKYSMAIFAAEVLGLDYNWNRKALQANL